MVSLALAGIISAAAGLPVAQQGQSSDVSSAQTEVGSVACTAAWVRFLPEEARGNPAADWAPREAWTAVAKDETILVPGEGARAVVRAKDCWSVVVDLADAVETVALEPARRVEVRLVDATMNRGRRRGGWGPRKLTWARPGVLEGTVERAGRYEVEAAFTSAAERRQAAQRRESRWSPLYDARTGASVVTLGEHQRVITVRMPLQARSKRR